MRYLHTIQGRTKLETFTAYLLTQGIETNAEELSREEDTWELWVRDEDQVEISKQELDAFLKDSSNPKYADAVRKAQELQRQRQQKAKEVAKLIRRPPNISPAVGGRRKIPPLTMTLVVLCIAVGILTNFGLATTNATTKSIAEELQFIDYLTWKAEPNNPAARVMMGEVWRIVTPIFLHGGPIHLIFNLIMLVQLGRIVETFEGTWRFSFIVLIIAIASNLLQGLTPEQPFGLEYLSFLGGSPLFVGISGVVFGIFGFLWIKSSLRPDLGISLHPVSVIIMIGWLCFGFLMHDSELRMANLCHLGGLLSGMFLGMIFAPKSKKHHSRN